MIYGGIVMANELKEKQQKLKKVRVRNIVLNLVCI